MSTFQTIPSVGIVDLKHLPCPPLRRDSVSFIWQELLSNFGFPRLFQSFQGPHNRKKLKNQVRSVREHQNMQPEWAELMVTVT